MNLQEYFVELSDRNILLDFPDNFDATIFKISGTSRHDYCISTLANVLRDLANIAEILENILLNLKNEINETFFIEFDQTIQDYKSELKVDFTYKFTNKHKKVFSKSWSIEDDYLSGFTTFFS